MNPLIKSIYKIMFTHKESEEENGYDMMIERLQTQINSQHECKKSAAEIIIDYIGWQPEFMWYRNWRRNEISDERLKEIKETVVTDEMKAAGEAMAPILKPSFRCYKVPGFTPTRDRKYTKGVFRRRKK